MQEYQKQKQHSRQEKHYRRAPLRGVLSGWSFEDAYTTLKTRGGSVSSAKMGCGDSGNTSTLKAAASSIATAIVPKVRDERRVDQADGRPYTKASFVET
jgi:hypothetical protein